MMSVLYQVLVGGTNVKDLNVKWLLRHIGVVSQEPVLFDTTIAENIALGKESATMEDIQAAAKKANAHDFISSLPDGYGTNVGEGGAQISGGQKQRIAIARALVRDPKILLLDEATSALDTTSERLVQEALDQASASRTTITIAHRLSTIRDATVILCMHAGQVVQKGTHDELMAVEGKYFDLVNAQEVQAPTTHAAKVTTASARVRSRRSVISVRKKDYLGDLSVVRHGSVLGGRQRATSRRRSVDDYLSLRRSVDDYLSESPRSRTQSQRKKKVLVAPSTAAKDLNESTVEIQLDGNEMIAAPVNGAVEETDRTEEEEEEDVPSISLFKLLSLNSKMFPVILLGCLGAIVNGFIYPSFSIIFGEVIQIFGREPDQILPGIHPYAAAFIGLGIVSAICIFIKVRHTYFSY